MKCKHCGAEIVMLHVYVEADVAREAAKTRIPPYIIRTNQPNPFQGTAAMPQMVMSYPCHHEPDMEDVDLPIALEGVDW